MRCLARAKHRGLLRVLAGRSLAANRRNRIAILLVHVGRSLATSCWCFFGCARSEAGLGCLRPSERSESAPPLFADRGSGVERVQSWRVSHRALAEQCRHLARGEWFGACAWPRPSASVGSVKPGCLSFPVEERSDGLHHRVYKFDLELALVEVELAVLLDDAKRPVASAPNVPPTP